MIADPFGHSRKRPLQESELPSNQHLLDHLSSLLREAGEKILVPAYREHTSKKSIKNDGSVVTETDLQCQQFMQSTLSSFDPDIGFLGEEMSHDEQLAALNSGGRFWCVDPLDGTTNFTIPMPHFGSSVALIEDGAPTLACIHDPLLGESFTASKGGGARLNGTPIQVTSESRLSNSVGFIDFKRLDEARATVLASRRLFRSQRNIGTCALEWAWLAAGRAHFIIHGGEKVWDYAAGLLLAEEAGAIVSDFENDHPFRISQLSSSIVAASDENIHQELLSVLQGIEG